MLDIHEYLPSTTLQKAIKGYYMVKYSFPAGTQLIQTAYPTGDTMLSIALKDRISLLDKEGNEVLLPWMLAVGQFIQPIQTRFSGEGDCVWVRFQPNGFYKLFNTSLQSMVNTYKHIDFYQIFTTEALSLSSNLQTLPLDSDKVGYLDTFFTKILRENDSIDKAIDDALQFIAKEKGLVKSASLHKRIYLSERTFQRHFEKQVGILPKTYCRLVRFTSCIQEIGHNQNSIQHILHQYEYYDHSHFYKEICFFTGKNPQFIKEDYDWFFKTFYKGD